MRKRKGGGTGIPRGSKSEELTGIESKAAGAIESVDDERGIVEAYVSVTGIKDSVGDVIEPGAYQKTLKERTPKGIWSHQWQEPVSKTLAIKEVLPGDDSLPDSLPNGEKWPSDAGALYVKTQFNLNTDTGRRAYENVKFFSDGTEGDTSAWSIGYKTKKSSKGKDGTRYIKELDLFEYSPVLHGANAHAKTLSVKSLGEAITALHAGGYDTTELEAKVDDSADGPFEGLSPAEVKAIPLAIDILSAYASELGVKTSTVQGDPDLDDPDGGSESPRGFVTLADRLEETLEPEDFTELLEAADGFDAAVQSWDGSDEAEDAVSEAAQAFLDVLEDEEAADPDDPTTWSEVRDCVASTFDDATAHLYGEDAVDDPDGDGDVEDEWGDDSTEDGDDADGYDDGQDEGDAGPQSAADGSADAGEGDVGGDVGKSARRRTEVKSPSAAKRDRAEESGAAMSSGKYPIENASDLKKAIAMRGQGNAPNKLINGHIVKRAKALGLEHLLPDDLKPDSGKSSDSKSLPDLGWESSFPAILDTIDFSEPSRV